MEEELCDAAEIENVVAILKVQHVRTNQQLAILLDNEEIKKLLEGTVGAICLQQLKTFVNNACNASTFTHALNESLQQFPVNLHFSTTTTTLDNNKASFATQLDQILVEQQLYVETNKEEEEEQEKDKRFYLKSNKF